MPLVILIGAAGSGKTTIAEAIEERFTESVDVRYFDRVGVPSSDQMIADYGSGEGWQRAMTIEWMLELARASRPDRKLLFEGQTRLSFLEEGSPVAGGLIYVPILVDCDDETRTHRLAITRRQPELANPDMMNWARYLRQQAKERGCQILDTTAISLDDAVEYVMARLK
jgi:hypothetical protein